MFSLIMTIVCSTSIALILKFNDVKKGDPLLLLMGNYFFASIVGLIFIFTDKVSTYSLETMFFGMLMGVFFVGSFFLFAKGVNIAGASLATVSSRLSVVTPILLSIVVFNETPGINQLIGFAFTFITILFFYFSLRSNNSGEFGIKEFAILFFLLVGIGLGDFGMKVFHNLRPSTDKSFFLFCIFFSSFIYSFVTLKIRKIPFKKDVIIRGTILGVPNIFSSYFLLGALASLAAIVVYPVVNIGIILLTTLSAVIFWKERINKYGLMSLIAGIISIYFLSI